MRFLTISVIIGVLLVQPVAPTQAKVKPKTKQKGPHKLTLQEQINGLGEKCDALQKKIELLQNVLPRYVRAIENLKKHDVVTPQSIPTEESLPAIPAETQALAQQLMKTAGHAQIDARGDKTAFMAYINLIDANDLAWATNVRSNKSALQLWLHDHGDQLTRDEFLRVLAVCEQCFITYRNSLESDVTMDKYFMVLVNRELYRFFYTHHGTNDDLRALLQQADKSDNALAWALIVAKRMGASTAAGVVSSLRDQLVGLYCAKLDATIAQASALTKPLYEKTKHDTVQWLNTLKIAS